MKKWYAAGSLIIAVLFMASSVFAAPPSGPSTSAQLKPVLKIAGNTHQVRLCCKAGNMVNGVSGGSYGAGGYIYETNDIIPSAQVRIFEIDTGSCSGNTCEPKAGGYFKIARCRDVNGEKVLSNAGNQLQGYEVLKLPAGKTYWMAGYVANNSNSQRGAFKAITNLDHDINMSGTCDDSEHADDLFFMYPLSALTHPGTMGVERFYQVMSWEMPTSGLEVIE